MNGLKQWMIEHFSYREMGITGMVILLGISGSMINRHYYDPIIKTKPSIQPVDINQASIETLQKLPFISLKRAGMIIECRNRDGRIQNARILQTQLRLSGKQICILERLIKY